MSPPASHARVNLPRETGARVWVIGSGGREHALAWKVAQSPKVAALAVVPGNDACSESFLGRPVERIASDLSLGAPEFHRLAAQAVEQKVDLVVVGPDNPLADGIVDAFEARGIACFGPLAGAARLEASKAFAKEVMTAAGVPTAKYRLFTSAIDAKAFLHNEPWGDGWVVKADGLALGKGVVVAESREEAIGCLESLIALSGSVVIEERLSGDEISWMAFCDGDRAVLLDAARDHKRIGDGDQGPNTGGMGAVSPVQGVTAALEERVQREVFLPLLREMNRRGASFRGVLYAGLMWDAARDRLGVLEFNVRFGDPEAQVLLARMQGDFYDWAVACATGRLDSMPARVPFIRDHAVVVVMASKGYPESPRKGDSIEGLEKLAAQGLADRPSVFVAGAKQEGQSWQTSGGRVLGVMGYGATLTKAQAEAYRRVGTLSFSGMHFRTDIGGREDV